MFDVDSKRRRIEELDSLAAAPDFWNNAEKAQATMRDQAQLKSTVDDYDAQMRALDDATVLIDLADEAKDEATAREADQTIAASEERVTKMEFARMLSGPFDQKGAILSINAGAGGTESQDWAQMLMRMYTRWAQRRNFKTEVLDLQAGDEAGIKSATITIDGEWAYGWLRAEAGVHRLVRISPFDANARRHTS
ncbi:MAG TPA: PCRF domain-containing protein, partial [Polyangia bacterium]|nr:PCRF domain-containing protein [Polyangia bacterium]